MKKLLFILIWCCIICKVQAQLIDKVWIYGDSGVQRATQCYIDRIGNRYQVIQYASNFIIDSSGSPITILTDSNNSQYIAPLAIIKFDTDGKYLYHIRLQSFGFSYGNLDIKFSFTNEIILCFYFPQYDSIDLVDSRGSLFKKIIPSFNRSVSGGTNNVALLVCKLNSDGQFIWANTIARENLPANQVYLFFGSFTISRTDEIIVYFPNIRSDTLFSADTISVTNNLNQKSLFFVNTKYILLKFSLSGILLSVKEPFKNMFMHQHADSSFDIKVVNMISDGFNTYGIFRFRITKPDTFKTANPQPLQIGSNYLLVKFNEKDSVLWTKTISRELQPNYYQINHFDYDTINQELAFATPFNPLLYDFLINPLYTSNHSGAYLCKLDPNGNIISENFIMGNDAMKTITSLTYNYFNRQLILIGFTNGNDTKLQKYMPANPFSQSTAFIAFMDSLNNIIAAESIINNNNNMSNTIYLNQFKMGYPLTDPNGRTFISGWFTDSISLPCKTLNATIETDLWGTPISDAFVLMVSPLVYIDTSTCYTLLSPSGKYVWDSTGLYFDTLTNRLGCDSILFFNVHVLSSKSELDSSVCKTMLSFSRKYIWDSTGTYFDTIQTVSGCDSIIKLRLFVNSSKLNIDTTYCSHIISPSGKYIWESSGIYIDTLLNTTLCDSIITVNYTRTSTSDTLNYMSCDSLLMPSGKFYIRTTGMYLDTLTTVNGCDSILYIYYSRLISFNHLKISICDTFISPSGKFIYKVSGVYSDTLTNQNGCDSIITINIYKPSNNLTITKSNNIDCNTLYTQLKAEGCLNYVWTPAENLSNANSSTPIATPKKSITYFITATDSLGCIFTDSIFLKVTFSDSLGFFPNVFTPNKDGINDCLPLKSLTEFKEIKFMVFNRWGNLVFETSDPEQCWQGNENNGQQLSNGVYYYTLNGNSKCNQQLSLHGSITIIR